MANDSLRFDFQKNMELKEEEMTKLFPKIEPDISNGFTLTSFLLLIGYQLNDMKIYCECMLV